MNEWKSIGEDERPQCHWHIVLVTDGQLTCLARFINNPKDWYGEDLLEWNEELQEDLPLEEEWHEPHWLFINEVGPFLGNDECFGNMDEITHWMDLPKPHPQDS